MCQDTDTSNAVVRPPIAWILALAAGVAADQLYPLRFVPASVPGAWVGGAIFALAIWAIVTIRNKSPLPCSTSRASPAERVGRPGQANGLRLGLCPRTS
jgi:hypothetical protein